MPEEKPHYCSDEDKPTELTKEDIDKVIEMSNNFSISISYCGWCGKENPVRDVCGNLICEKCEKKERKAGRPIVFSTPVKDAYWKFDREF